MSLGFGLEEGGDDVLVWCGFSLWFIRLVVNGLLDSIDVWV